MNIVRPSAMQRVAASLKSGAAPAADPPRSAGATGPARRASDPEPLRYSELTPEMIGALRVLRALEVTYPHCGDKASRTLDGHKAWREARSRVISRSPGSNPRMDQAAILALPGLGYRVVGVDHGLAQSQPSADAGSDIPRSPQSPCDLERNAT